jgi:hypothetical protein
LPPLGVRRAPMAGRDSRAACSNAHAKAAPQGRCRYIKPIAASTKHDPCQYHRLRASSCILDTAAFHVGDFFGELRLHVIERIDRKIM